jgi:beta-lactamase class A
MNARAPHTPRGRRARSIGAALAAAAVVLAPPASGQRASPPPDPDAVPRLFDPRTRAPAPRFMNVNGSAPRAEVPRFFRGSGDTSAAQDDGDPPPHPWAKRLASAVAYARAREGRVALAVVDDEGRVRGYHRDEQHRSASVVKAMLMVAFLNREPQRDRDLRASERRLVKPMIMRSHNDSASTIRDIVGAPAVNRVAQRAGMNRFAFKRNWGNTLITARDQALLFSKIDRLVVARHRGYARSLLASIVPDQRWGIPRALPPGWTIFFKGGWRRGLVNQVALIEQGDRRVSMAVLTDDDPSHDYGVETIRGVARRLLRGLR